MALVKLGTGIAGLSGTVGGITFSRCKAGTTAKMWARGSNPQALYQQYMRGVTSQWPQQWKDLTQNQRDLWDALAATPPETDYDPFGNVVKRSGYNWFVRLNNRRVLTYQSPLEDAPAAVTPAAPTIASFVCHAPTGFTGDTYCTFSDTEFDAGEYLVVLMNFSSGGGNRTKKVNFKMCGVLEAAGETTFDWSGLMIYRWGQFPAGWLATGHFYRQTTDSFRSIPTIIQTLAIT